MSDAAITARLAELAKNAGALHRRPEAATRTALAAVFDRFADENSAERHDLAAELPAATGFSEPVVREGLRRGLADWTGERFLELVFDEIGRPTGAVHGFATTADET